MGDEYIKKAGQVSNVDSMTDRQRKSFKLMYEDGSYPPSAFYERFGLRYQGIHDLAKSMGLKHRKITK